MKKLFLLALCLVMSSLLLTGCADRGEGFTEKTYTSDAQVQEVLLDVKDRQVQVLLSNDEQVHITYWQSETEFYDISVSDDGVLTMESASDKSWTDYIGLKADDAKRKITLEVPDAMLQYLSVFTTNEDITLSRLTVAESIALVNNGGDVDFGTVDVGTGLMIDVKNGDITGTIVGGYDDFTMKTSIKKGENNLPAQKDGGEKTLNVFCNNGDVEITFTK